MLGSASVAHHTVEGARLLEDLVHSGLNRFFLGNICLQGEDAVGELLCYLGEFVAWLADVDGVDCFGAVGEAAVCYAETDAWGGGVNRCYLLLYYG